jgi:endonuclease VIII
LESHPELDIGIALLNQSLIAGVGNMFKSEICFLAGVNPFARIQDLSRNQLEQLVSIAGKTMRQPAGRSGRRYVYRRNLEPCLTCGSPILSRKQGPDARTSFWCPVCQSC